MRKIQTSTTARRQRKAKIWPLPSSVKNEPTKSSPLKKKGKLQPLPAPPAGYEDNSLGVNQKCGENQPLG